MFDHHERRYLKAAYVACSNVWMPGSRYDYDRVPESREVAEAKRVFVEVFMFNYEHWARSKDARDRSAGTVLGFAEYQLAQSLPHLDPRHTRIDEARRLAEVLGKYFGLMENGIFHCPLGERFDTRTDTYKRAIETFLTRHAQFTNVIIGSVDFVPIIKVLEERLVVGIRESVGPAREQITRMGQKPHQEFIRDLIHEFYFTQGHFKHHGRGGAEHLYLRSRPGYAR
ncbi:hypothetical protein J4419_06470 [Candidatus Woesearchaeota archaeon]|nr:hypothetical protein [Candidatus Woesearchaeota archaeon]